MIPITIVVIIDHCVCDTCLAGMYLKMWYVCCRYVSDQAPERLKVLYQHKVLECLNRKYLYTRTYPPCKYLYTRTYLPCKYTSTLHSY